MLKNISKPTNTIIKEIIDFFKTTNHNHFAITWGSGCAVFIKRKINDETGFVIGYTQDWLGRFKKYSDTFTINNLPVKLFNFIGARDMLLTIKRKGELVNELQTSNLCEGIRRSMNNPEKNEFLLKHFKFNIEEGFYDTEE